MSYQIVADRIQFEMLMLFGRSIRISCLTAMLDVWFADLFVVSNVRDQWNDSIKSVMDDDDDRERRELNYGKQQTKRKT